MPLTQGKSQIAAALSGARQLRAGGGGLHMPHVHMPKVHKPHGSKHLKLHTGPIHSSVAGRTDHLPMHVPSGAYVIPADIISGMGEGNTVAGFKVAKSIFSSHFYGSGSPYGASGLPYGMPAPGKAHGGAADGPLYEHDCPDCKFVGVDRPRAGEPKSNGVDMYVHPTAEGGTGIRRYSSEPSDHGALPRKMLRGKSDDKYDPVFAAYDRPEKAAGGSASVPIVAAGGEYVISPSDVTALGKGNMDDGHKILDEFVKQFRAKTVKTLKALPGPKKN